MTSMLTRRSAVAALAGVSVTAALAPAAVAQPLDRTAWADALALYRTQTAALTVANKAVDAAETIYFRCCPARPTFVLEMEGDYGRFGKHVLPLTIAHDELDDPARTWREPDKIEEFRRTLAEYRADVAALNLEVGLSKAEDARDKVEHRHSEALAAVIAMPAPDMIALGQKLEIIIAEFTSDGDGLAAVLADINRFAGREG